MGFCSFSLAAVRSSGESLSVFFEGKSMTAAKAMLIGAKQLSLEAIIA